MGLEMLVGCQYGDVHQIIGLGCTREVRAGVEHFGITFLEVLLGVVEVGEF